MLNNQLKSDLHRQQLLAILNTTNLESDIARFQKYVNQNLEIANQLTKKYIKKLN